MRESRRKWSLNECYAFAVIAVVVAVVAAGLWAGSLNPPRNAYNPEPPNYLGPILLCALVGWVLFFSLLHAIVRSAVAVRDKS